MSTGINDHCDQVALGITGCLQAGSQCDVSLRNRASDGSWEHRSCHSSVLGALSPVLRQVLTDPDLDEEVVVISEVEGGVLLDLLYTGVAECDTKAEAGELWVALAELGVEGSISLGKVTKVEARTSVAISDEATGVETEKAVMHIVLGVEPGLQDFPGKSVNLVGQTLACETQQIVTTEYRQNLPESREKVVKNTRDADACLECTECGDMFVTETNLRTHIADIHTKVRCKHCGLQMKGSIRLVDHTAVKHPVKKHSVKQESEFPAPTCNICHETFVTNQALKFHHYKHSGLKPFKCKICQASFRTPSTLKSHVEVQHTESRHRCEICGMKSSTSGKLKIHMRTHTNEKPYQCTFCPTTFKQLSVLKVHEFTHTKKSNHKCDRCGNFFPTKNRLISHKTKPVCVSRIRAPPGYKKYKTPKTRKLSNVLDELEPNNTMERVTTYLIQSEEGVHGLPLQQLEQTGDEEVGSVQTSYEQPMVSSYQGDALDTLETGEIPVLVDNLPVIIQTDIARHRLEETGEDLAKEQEMMFSL